MHVSIPYQVTASQGLSSDGGVLTSALILNTNIPSSGLEAASKQYIDSKVSSISADSIISGVIPRECFPEFNGDVVSDVKLGQVNLPTTGISAGVYGKVAVNVKGQAIQGFQLTSDDIPSVNFNSFAAGVPTTLSGYGITDGLSSGGGMMSGVLQSSAIPTQSLHVVTKQYVDTIALSNSNAIPGDITQTYSVNTPVGFLRCNGGEVSKSTYSALYAVIGDQYSHNLVTGSGKPWVNQYGINNTELNNATTWTHQEYIATKQFNSQVVVTKNFVYLLGGYIDANTYVNTIYAAAIDVNGVTGTWSASGTIPDAVFNSQAIVVKNKFHLISGYDGGLLGFKVYTTTISATGTLGTWTSFTSANIANAISGHQIIVTRSKVFLMGGSTYNTTASNKVYFADINSDGTLTDFSEYYISLPEGLSAAKAFTTKNRVYLMGGINSTGSVDRIWTAVIKSDGTLDTWTQAPSTLPIIGELFSLYTTSNKAYFFYSSGKFYTTDILTDGTISGTFSLNYTATYTSSPMLPAPLFATSTRVYIVGMSFDPTTGNTALGYTTLNGGLNDYSTYYDGSLIQTDPNNFVLPDYTGKEQNDLHYYIKY